MSYNIYAPLAAFLPGDLRTRVNAEVTGSPLVAGSVIVSRTPQTDAPRDHNAPALTVELVPLPAQRGATLGIGYVEELIPFLAFVTRKRKDTREGADQLSDVEAITRAIAHSYDGVSDRAKVSGKEGGERGVDVVAHSGVN